MLVEELHQLTDLGINLLQWYATTASRRYKVFTIPKKTGGDRTIEQPAKEIKSLQRILCKILFEKLPVHASATAYNKGGSIKKNAQLHVKSNFTLHVDLVSFFPSFKSNHVVSFLRKKNKGFDLGLNTSDILFAAQIVCRNDGLTIGAPSSPTLTNIMMFDFDSEISKWCKAEELSYSRYADDIFISTTKPDKLAAALKHLRKALTNFKFAELKVNEDKLAFLSRRYRRNITGLVLTPDHRISIGLEKKLKMKSDLYKYKQGILAPEAVGSLVGMIAFTNDVEPTFVDNLRRKYGADTIAKLTKQAKSNFFDIGRKSSETTRSSKKNPEKNS